MKITLLVLFLFCTVAAFSQSSAPVLSSQPSIAQFTEHPEHAEPHAMAAEHPIVGGASDSYSYAQGEQPLWQFGPSSVPCRSEMSRAPIGKRSNSPGNPSSFSKSKGRNQSFGVGEPSQWLNRPRFWAYCAAVFRANRRSRASADAQNDSVPSCISQKELKF